MKKLITFLFILFSFGALSAQNLNFKDTTGLKNLLCSHTWFRYYLNPDSSFSDRIVDSIKFYPNGTLFKSARHKDDTTQLFFGVEIINGKWKFGSTCKITRNDTATDCISIEMNYTTVNGRAIGYWTDVLVDWHRIKGSQIGKKFGNINIPFIAENWQYGWDKLLVWQAPRQFKKSKKH